MAVLLLRAEHYDLHVFVDLYIVPEWPVKEIFPFDCFLCAVRVRCRELPAQDETPVWATGTKVAIQSY